MCSKCSRCCTKAIFTAHLHKDIQECVRHIHASIQRGGQAEVSMIHHTRVNVTTYNLSRNHMGKNTVVSSPPVGLNDLLARSTGGRRDVLGMIGGLNAFV